MFSKMKSLYPQFTARHFHATKGPEDYYSSLNLINLELLGVNKNASQSDIKKAYFKLAKKYHPDVNKAPDANAKFSEINKAYETLSDEKKRKMYDSGFNPDSENQPPPGWNQGPGNYQDFDQFSQAFSEFGFNPFESIFGSMGGFGKTGRGRQRDVQYNYDINVGKYNDDHSIKTKF